MADKEVHPLQNQTYIFFANLKINFSYIFTIILDAILLVLNVSQALSQLSIANKVWNLFF